MKASFAQYYLEFKFPAKTSRETMTRKQTYFIKLSDPEKGISGIGECALFRGLSCDDTPNYEKVLYDICANINHNHYIFQPNDWNKYPSIKFGFETASKDLTNGGRRLIYNQDWSSGKEGIRINGLVWMGNKNEMLSRLHSKISQGFKCVKLKIGGINFNEEVDIISHIRSALHADVLEIRLDANGAFNPSDALQKLDLLSHFNIHSIEQPIKPGNWEQMKIICRESPIPIALDEELIGINDFTLKQQLLNTINPNYIILKPALCGGFSGADEWINVAQRLNIKWWATSALESNIGLNAITQWVATKLIELPQGLGTGQLYNNNITSPIDIVADKIIYRPNSKWILPTLNWITP